MQTLIFRFKSLAACCIIILTVKWVKCATTKTNLNKTANIKIWATVNEQEYFVELAYLHPDTEPGDEHGQRNTWSVAGNTPTDHQTKHWTKIKIDQPPLNEIPPFNFDKFSYLREFEMSHHNLTEIHGFDFQNAAYIWNFNLSHNNIEQIYGGTFVS